MKSTDLGLPLEYQIMPEYFDAHNDLDDTRAKNALLESLLKTQKVKTILDLTCGTGSQVFYLTKHGYDVTGADFSPDLIKIAREKAKKENLEIKFIDADMRTLRAGKFDAAITMFNAVGHLTKADFEKSMANIGENLNAGGIYIFDIFNIDAMSEQGVDDLEMDLTKQVGDTTIHDIQYSTLNKDLGHLTSYDKYTIQKGSEKPKTLTNEFTLQIYGIDELKEMLARTGFEVLSHHGMDGSDFVKTSTPAILTVARKI